jgi:hypothetical protein
MCFDAVVLDVYIGELSMAPRAACTANYAARTKDQAKIMLT